MQLFDRARLKLTGWYVLIITLISLFFSGAIYRIQVREIQRFEAAQRLRIEHRLGSGVGFIVIDSELLDEAKRRLLLTLLALNSFVVVLAGGLGYILAGRTLAPIEVMVADQKRFISDAAHELRTPLTAMKTSLEVYLRDKKPTLITAREVLIGNAKDVDRLQSLADSLLTLSQLQENNSRAHFASVDLQPVIQDALTQVAPIAHNRRIKMASHLRPVTVHGYYYHLVQLSTILIDNAVKYSETRSGRVTVRLSREGNVAVLTIKDNGIGILPADLEHIFDRFFRSDAARTHNGEGGYGLGLSIAKKIVDSHSGSINVKSVSGKGSTFTVRIPALSA